VDIDGALFRWIGPHDVGEVVELLTCTTTLEVSGVIISRCGLCHEEFAAGDDCIADVMDDFREAIVVRFWHLACAERDARQDGRPN
jgi:hypothetical protein